MLRGVSQRLVSRSYIQIQPNNIQKVRKRKDEPATVDCGVPLLSNTVWCGYVWLSALVPTSSL